MSEGFADLPGDLLGPDAIESIESIVEAVTVHGLDGLARV